VRGEEAYCFMDTSTEIGRAKTRANTYGAATYISTLKIMFFSFL
jgi:hypothetical protein